MMLEEEPGSGEAAALPSLHPGHEGRQCLHPRAESCHGTAAARRRTRATGPRELITVVKGPELKIADGVADISDFLRLKAKQKFEEYEERGISVRRSLKAIQLLLDRNPNGEWLINEMNATRV